MKRVFTVAKYDPMGTTIMPKVKARSFKITDLEEGLWSVRSSQGRA